jgi:hypothetical protein
LPALLWLRGSLKKCWLALSPKFRDEPRSWGVRSEGHRGDLFCLWLRRGSLESEPSSIKHSLAGTEPLSKLQNATQDRVSSRHQTSTHEETRRTSHKPATKGRQSPNDSEPRALSAWPMHPAAEDRYPHSSYTISPLHIAKRGRERLFNRAWIQQKKFSVLYAFFTPALPHSLIFFMLIRASVARGLIASAHSKQLLCKL